MKIFSIQEKALFLIVVSILLVAGCSAVYFGGIIKSLQDEQCEMRAEELGHAIAANIDKKLVRKLKEDVQAEFDWSKVHIDNTQEGAKSYEQYLKQFEKIERSPAYDTLYHSLRDLLYATEADSIYVGYLDKRMEAMVYMVDAGFEDLRRPGSFDYLHGEDLFAINDDYLAVGRSVASPEVYGDIIGIAVPIHNDSGEAIAYVGVDIRMEEFTAIRNRILWNSVLTVIVVTLLLCAFYLYFSGRVLTDPEDTQGLNNGQEEAEKGNVHLNAQRVREEKKISELTESLSELLLNIPALTFSKDVINGKSLACNQMFAEFANKSSPSQVVGLTDEELFDEKTAANSRENDKIVLSMNRPYIYNEEKADAHGNVRFLQTTKLQFMAASGRFCLLSMSVDVTEMTMAKRESAKTMEAYKKVQDAVLNYSRIARALASDYNFVYYVDLRDDTYKTYNSTNEKVGLEIAEEGEDFFNLSLTNANVLIYKEDQEYFRRAFSKENIIKSIRDHGQFVVAYRLLIEGVPTHVGMRAVYLEDDINHIIIGVHSIEAQMRESEGHKQQA